MAIFESTGSMQAVDANHRAMKQDTLDEKVRVALAGGDHLWMIIQYHLVSPRALMGSKPVIMDAESLVDVWTGCYLCEQPFSKRLATRRCKGTAP